MTLDIMVVRIFTKQKRESFHSLMIRDCWKMREREKNESLFERQLHQNPVYTVIRFIVGPMLSSLNHIV